MRNILMAIVGLSPQVITETLFALRQEHVFIDEIHVITTRTGLDCINSHLLAPREGWFHRYAADYGIHPGQILFNENTIHILRDACGKAIEDIRDIEDNEILLGACLNAAWRLTSNPDSTVYFSIAGGRKTMSACLMVAAQLYGRRQDRICHVLVPTEFENNRDFYYPPPKPVHLEITNRWGEKFVKSTAYAKVSLVSIPFISVREDFTDRQSGRPPGPERWMKRLIRGVRPSLRVNLKTNALKYKNIELKMMPSHLALYAFFLMQKKKCRKQAADCRDCTDCYLDYLQISASQQIITQYYKRLGGATEDKGICALEKDTLRAYISKIRKDIQKAFGLTALAELGIESVGKKPDTRYGIKIDREKIRIVL